MSEFNNHLLPITLHPRKQNWNFFIFVINGNQTLISQIYRVDFFSPLGFEAKSDFGHKTSRLKPHSIRALVVINS